MPFLILDPSAVIRCSTQCEGQVSHAAFYGDLVAKAGIKGQADQVASSMGARSVLNNFRVVIDRDQEKQIHSNIPWTLGIPKM